MDLLGLRSNRSVILVLTSKWNLFKSNENNQLMIITNWCFVTYTLSLSFTLEYGYDSFSKKYTNKWESDFVIFSWNRNTSADRSKHLKMYLLSITYLIELPMLGFMHEIPPSLNIADLLLYFFTDRSLHYLHLFPCKEMVYLTTLSTHFIYGYMASDILVKDHYDSEKGNPLPPHRLLFPINSKGSFICTIQQTG